MEQVRIDNNLVHSHGMWTLFGSNLKNIAYRDYGEDVCFRNIDVDCIDVDQVETQRTHQADNTVDASIGISAISDNCNSKYFMLVELRMGYGNINNVKFSEWKHKVKHSVDIISSDIAPIRPMYFFVFSESLIHQVVKKLDQYKKTDAELRRYEAVSVKDFENACVMPDDWPKPLLFNSEQLQQQLRNIVEQNDLNKLVDCYYYWKEEAIKYKFKHNLREVAEIKHVFYTVLSSIDCTDRYDGWIELILEELQ